jgi:hypothetical protein
MPAATGPCPGPQATDAQRSEAGWARQAPALSVAKAITSFARSTRLSEGSIPQGGRHKLLEVARGQKDFGNDR